MIAVWTDSKSDRIAEILAAPLKNDYQVRPLADPLVDLGPDDVVLAVGTDAANRLQALGMAPTNLSLAKMRDRQLCAESGPKFICTYAPGITLREWRMRGLMKWDARLARRLHDTGTTRPKIGNYRWTHDLTPLVEFIKREADKTGKPARLAGDLETEGLYPWYQDRGIVTSQWSAKRGTAVVVNHLEGTSDRLAADIEWLLTAPEVRLWGANLKFDLGWIKQKWGLDCLNFTFDTLVAGSLVDENRNNSLNWHAKEHTELGGYDDDFNERFDKAEMAEALRQDPDAFLTYAGGDPDACLRTGYRIQERLHQDPRLERFYLKLLHPAVRTFEKIEARGLLVDQEKFAELRTKLVPVIREHTTKAFDLIPSGVKCKYMDDLKIGRKGLLVDYLFDSHWGLGLTPQVFAAKQKYGKRHPKAGLPYPSTSIKDHLGRFEKHPEAGPFIKELREINSATKTLSTYVDGFMKHLRPDGRFHPTYALHNGALFEGRDGDDEAGTVTGRTSAKDPAVQTIPKHTKWAKHLRACYPAPEGMLFWEADFSQGELRVAGCMADEPNMLQLYRDGYDLHAGTGASLAGVEIEEFLGWKPEDHAKHALFKKYRQEAKAGNFGLLYRMSAGGFQDYALKTYGVEMSLDEAEDFKDDWFAMYPGLLDWHTDQVAYARKHKFVRSPLGRKRHLPLIDTSDGEKRSASERYAINSPVQSCLSDMNLFAGHIIDERLGGHDDVLSVNGATHDCLYGYVRERDHREHLAAVVEVMSNLPLRSTFGWEHQIDFPAEVEAGPTWADMREVKF